MPWIKFEKITPEKPEVLKIARMLNLDRDTVVGKLVRFWSWVDDNSSNGYVTIQYHDVDRICGHLGFASAMKSVKWLDYDDEDEQVLIPNFDRHNGQTAKARALTQKRVAEFRKRSERNASVTKPLPDKIREEVPPNPLKGEAVQVLKTKPKQPTLTDDLFIAEIKKHYPDIDVDKELGKMRATLLTPKFKGRKLTRRFMVGWLNRCDVPMQGSRKEVRSITQTHNPKMVGLGKFPDRDGKTTE